MSGNNRLNFIVDKVAFSFGLIISSELEIGTGNILSWFNFRDEPTVTGSQSFERKSYSVCLSVYFIAQCFS